MSLYKHILNAAVLCALYTGTTGQNPDLQCYSCISTQGDLTCLNNPDMATGQNVVTCANGWCTIYRQEPIEVPGEIISFLRGCEKKEPTFLDSEESDSHQVHYYRSCRTNRCNKGDGLSSIGRPGDGSGGLPDLYIVGAESGATPTVQMDSKSAIFILFAILFHRIY